MLETLYLFQLLKLSEDQLSFHSYNKLFDFSFSRPASIYHTRFRLGFSSLTEHLYKINRCASPYCECGLDYESVKHLFLFCPRYAAQRNFLLTSAARILGEKRPLCSYLENDNFLRRDFDDIACVQIPWRSRKYHINCSL